MNLPRAIEEFSSYHRSTGNRFCHFIGIPVITIAVLGCLAKIEWGISFFPAWEVQIDLALILLAITFVFDVRYNAQLAISVLLAGLLAYFVGSNLSLSVLLILFVIGWIFQLSGHIVYERNSPAFMTNLRHFYIGPRWLIVQLLAWCRIEVFK